MNEKWWQEPVVLELGGIGKYRVVRNTREAAECLGDAGSHGERAEVWFCGPRGFGDQLKAGLARLWGRRLSFRREAFEMR